MMSSNREMRDHLRSERDKYRRVREEDFIRETEEVTRKSYNRKFLTVVVSDGPRHILRRPR